MRAQGSTTVALQKKKDDNVLEIRYQTLKPFSEKEEEKQVEENKQTENAKNEDQEIAKEAKDVNLEVDFSIIVTRPNKSGMLLDCNSLAGFLKVKHIFFSGNIGELVNSTKSISKSEGIHFFNLEKKQQEDILGYLKYLGIGEGILAYIEHSAINKDQFLFKKLDSDIKKYDKEL